MRKLKLVFNEETGMYNPPVELNAEELKVFNLANSDFKAAKDEALAFVATHPGKLTKDEIKVADGINNRLTNAAKDLESIGIKMNYEYYII